MSSALELALGIALEAHRGQRDKGGNVYILHPIRVMMKQDSEEAMIVALIHDVVEDSDDWTLKRLQDMGFSNSIVNAVDSMTRRVGESYEDFILRCKADPIATQVKLADLNDNTDLRRLPDPGPKDFERVLKYLSAIRVLSDDGAGKTHDKRNPKSSVLDRLDNLTRDEWAAIKEKARKADESYDQWLKAKIEKGEARLQADKDGDLV